MLLHSIFADYFISSGKTIMICEVGNKIEYYLIIIKLGNNYETSRDTKNEKL
jgi:hypothetical protein